MNLSEARNALKAMGLDPDVFLQSPDFLSRWAEIDRIDSKYLDAIAIAAPPAAIELIEEHLLALFDVSAEEVRSGFLSVKPNGLELYGKWLEAIKIMLGERAQMTLPNHSGDSKARIRLRLAARAKLFSAKASEEFARITPQPASSGVRKTAAKPTRPGGLRKIRRNPPGEDRQGIYRALWNWKDSETGERLLNSTTGVLRSKAGLYETIFCDAIARIEVLPGCDWDTPRLATMGRAWDEGDSKRRKKMRDFLRRLVKDCAPFKDVIIKAKTRK